MGFFGGQFLVRGFYWVLLEVQGIFGGFDFFPLFSHPQHLKSRVPPPGLATCCGKVKRKNELIFFYFSP